MAIIYQAKNKTVNIAEEVIAKGEETPMELMKGATFLT